MNEELNSGVKLSRLKSYWPKVSFFFIMLQDGFSSFNRLNNYQQGFCF